MNKYDELDNFNRMENYAWRTETEMEVIKNAQAGDAEAQYQMGHWHLEGGAIMVKKNKAKAAEWLKMAVAQGHKEAQEALDELESEK